MSIIGQLIKATGKVGKKVFAEAVSVADGDAVDTGLRSIDGLALTPSADRFVSATSVTGGVITIGLKDTTGTAVTTPETVYIIAIGDPR